jgi:hypothetical protein
MRAVRTAPRTQTVWRLVAATATTLILVAGTYGASVRHQKQERMKALRAESRRIQSELQRVKAMAEESEPVLVLEKGDTRVIVDNQQSQPIYY